MITAALPLAPAHAQYATEETCRQALELENLSDDEAAAAQAVGDAYLDELRSVYPDMPANAGMPDNWVRDRILATLAECYYRGTVVDQDKARALALYEQAATAGMTRWQYYLSRIHEAGLYGQPIDAEQAEYWRNLQPKIHVVTYNCVIASAYAEGLVFDRDEHLAAEFQRHCLPAGKGDIE